MSTVSVVIYGRPGCHLCDEALALLQAERAQRPFALEQRDIERDEALFKRYLERIPVVEIDGEEAFELDEMTAGALRARVAEARAARGII